MSKASATPPATPTPPPSPTGRTISRGAKELRDTIESVVIAFVLAFLFRTFEAEAFVIPTGSMAPTLYGRHKETVCTACGYRIVIGASQEIEQDTAPRDPRSSGSGYFKPAHFVDTAYCPNCRAPNSFTMADPVFNGDRILVNKYPYEFGTPQRWDVFVFKYPEQPRTNYIKRLVGLPGETLRILQGDVYLSEGEGDAEELTILRKDDPSKQRELQILVYDDRYPAQELLDLGWPERWAAMEPSRTSGGLDGWVETETGWRLEEDREYVLALEDAREATCWLRYRHFVPEPSDWSAVRSGSAANLRPRAELITDFCGYNAHPGRRIPDFGLWVGDLTLSCALQIDEVADAGGQVVFELNEGSRAYRCRIDVPSGQARLTLADTTTGGGERDLATAQTSVVGPGTYTVTFANVDNRLCLWVDDEPIEFGEQANYEPPGGVGNLQRPTDADLVPVGIGATGVEVRVSQLLLERDIYYRSVMREPPGFNSGSPGPGIEEYHGDAFELQRFEADPGRWFDEYVSHLSILQTGPGQEFEGVDFRFVLGEDEFFGMGDNSPESQDSRLWSNERRRDHRHAIPRSHLVGKAFFIYWPHGTPFLNGGRGYPDGPDSIFNAGPWRGFFYHRRANGEIEDRYPQFRVPFYPNVRRMERIR